MSNSFSLNLAGIISKNSMNIKYGRSKEVECYRDFVLNPEDRKASRAFAKTFGAGLMSPAKRLHERLVEYDSAGDYNALFGQTDNRIEIKQGCAKKDPLILKVRVGRGPRKFFNHMADADGGLLLTRDWQGDFRSVKNIYIIAVNNHDYNSI